METKMELRAITQENFRACVMLEVEPAQKEFVARNVLSLAEAWLYPNNARPFAIYHGEEPVGFVMLDIDVRCDGSHSVCGVWRLMIDKNHQGKGYGKAALREVIRSAREDSRCETLHLSYVPGNETAERLYGSLGFIATGKLIDGECEMVLELR